MLNIISRSIISRTTSGPQKVALNLVKGLQKIGYPYVINKRLDACKRLWIHDDTRALEELSHLDPSIKVIVGPNLYVLPRHIPKNIDLSRAVYIHPSPWVEHLWKQSGFDRCPLDSWPVGIDTEDYKPGNFEKKHVLIYFKQRFPEELAYVRSLLEAKNISYEIITYGKYTEKEYRSLLSATTYCIWIGRQESQGIALEEALAANVPLLVWDVKNLGHWQASAKEMSVFNDTENAFREATSAYFFDDRCGIKIKEREKINEAIDTMQASWQTFKPREYIVEDVSLEKQARDLLMLYQKHFGLYFEQGFSEKLLTGGSWINDRLSYKIITRLKDIIKKIR